MAATSSLTVSSNSNQRLTKLHQKTIAPKPTTTTAYNSMTLNMKNKHSKTNTKTITPSSSTSTTSPSENSVSSSVSTTTLLHNRISGGMSNRGGRKTSSGMIPHPTLGYPVLPPQPAKVQRRNARERNRVKQVNTGFDHLRSHIPSAAKHKKMSKVDTLRHAVDYIQSLTNMLQTADETGNPCMSITSSSEKTNAISTSRASPEVSVPKAIKSSPPPGDVDEFFETTKLQSKFDPKFEESSHVMQSNKPPPLSFHGQQQNQQHHLSTPAQPQYVATNFISHQQHTHHPQPTHGYPLTPRTPNSPESGFVESTSGYESATNSYSHYMNYNGGGHSPNTHLMHPGQANSSPDMPHLIMPAMSDNRHHSNPATYQHNPTSNNVNTLLLPGASATFQHHNMGRLNDGRANSASPTSPSVYSDHSSAFINPSNVGLIHHHQQQQQLQHIELVPSVIGHPHTTNINHHTNELNSYFKYQDPEGYTTYGDGDVASDEDDILDAIAKWQET